MRSSCCVVLRDSDSAIHSYLEELRNIAMNSQSLNPSTLDKLKKAEIFLASRWVKRKESDKVTDHVDGDEDWIVEYALRLPDQVAIMNDALVYQRFDKAIFCAPEDPILEGEYGSTYPQFCTLTLETVAFYESLGCELLSDLVQEEYKWTGETPWNGIALKVRSLVLERLPLFLHENTHQTTLFSLKWLNNDENFIVQSAEKVMITRSIDFAGAKLSLCDEVSAIAAREDEGRVELWVTDDVEADMYDVAYSLCHLLFHRPKVNDIFLFSMMLSTDLHTLRRRGYNGDYEVASFFGLANRIPTVDRILKQQEAEARAKEADQTVLVSLPTSPTPSTPSSPPAKKLSSGILLFRIKGPDEPMTGLEAQLLIPGGVAPTTLGRIR